MVKTFKIILVAALTLLFVTVIIYAKGLQRNPMYLNNEMNQTFFGDNLYESNRYAQPDDKTIFVFETSIPEGFEQIGSTPLLELYYHFQSYLFIVRNKLTGYLWYSYAQDIELESLNPTMRSLLTSPFYIEYFPYNSQTEKLSTTARREILTNVHVATSRISNGIELKVTYRRLDISFHLKVYLDNDNLVAYIPRESIHESVNLIHTIQILPNFGSTRGTDIPGYILIPDGPGALYRFKDNNERQPVTYLSRYYGVDMGVKMETQINPLNRITMPIFGMTHGVNQHAYLGIIESGDANANFVMSPSLANGLNYNLTGAQFILRESYVFPTNLKGDGIPQVISNHYDTDLKIRYLFTEPMSSNYVGMALLYQDYLVNTKQLKKTVLDESTIRLEVLQSDSKKGLFGMNDVIMTTFDQTRKIVETLNQDGVKVSVVLKGWNKGGFSGQMPYSMSVSRKLGGSSGFNRLKNYTELEAIKLSLYGDYTTTYKHSGRVSEKSDYARGVYRRIMIQDLKTIIYNKQSFLYPSTTEKLLKVDKEFYEKNNAALSLDKTHHLFGFYKKSYFDRSISVEMISQGLSDYDRLNLYTPNAYLFEYMDAYYDVPMYNAQYTFYDDTVPFLSIVLKGYVDLYAPLQNFFASTDEQTLMLIDFGLNPSFIVTERGTHLLKYTQANQYFSTEFNVWKPIIKDVYEKTSKALNVVVNERIINREVITPGIVKTTYENGVFFITNYTDSAYIYYSVEIPSKDYYLGGV